MRYSIWRRGKATCQPQWMTRRRRTSPVRRGLLCVKLALLAIVIWNVAIIINGRNDEQKHTADPVVKAPRTEIALLERQPPFNDYEMVLERDLFGLVQPDEINNELEKDGRTALSAKPPGSIQLQFRLLGTIAGSEKVARAVIEDMETKLQGLYATGDSIQGVRIDKIERTRIILLGEDGQEMLDLHVASPHSPMAQSDVKSATAKDEIGSEVVRILSPTEREIDKRAFAAKVGRMDAVLRAVKFSPHVVDEKEEGLRITGLEGLNVASYIGLKNGDVVQGLNGQTITNRRKAFQVLRRAQRLPSSDIEFLRGAEKKTLSLKMR